MGKHKSYGAEQIIMKLREADVLIAQGKTVRELCRAFGQPSSTQRYQRREKGMKNGSAIIAEFTTVRISSGRT